MAHASLTPRARLTELGIGAAWLLAIRAGLLLVAALVDSSPLAEVVLGALLCDVASGRAGLSWSDDEEPPRAVILRRVGLGLGLGALLAAAALALSVLLGFARISHVGIDGVALLGTIGATASAIRDELLFRGLPIMFARRAQLSPAWGVGFGALVAPSGFLLTPQANIENVLLAIALGLLFGRLLVTLRGAWAAVAAHTAWASVVGVIAHGAFVELDWSTGELGLGEMARGAPAFVAVPLVLLAAAFVVPRFSSRASLDPPEPTR